MNLLQAMFSTLFPEAWHGPKWDVRSLVKAQDEKSVSSATPVKDENPYAGGIHRLENPYAGDIHRLEEALHNGHPLESGSCINITLQELLKIVPRKRRRIDAYRGLVSKLKNIGVTLTIKSQKSK